MKIIIFLFALLQIPYAGINNIGFLGVQDITEPKSLMYGHIYATERININIAKAGVAWKDQDITFNDFNMKKENIAISTFAPTIFSYGLHKYISLAIGNTLFYDRIFSKEYNQIRKYGISENFANILISDFLNSEKFNLGIQITPYLYKLKTNGLIQNEPAYSYSTKNNPFGSYINSYNNKWAMKYTIPLSIKIKKNEMFSPFEIIGNLGFLQNAPNSFSDNLLITSLLIKNKYSENQSFAIAFCGEYKWQNLIHQHSILNDKATMHLFGETNLKNNININYSIKYSISHSPTLKSYYTGDSQDRLSNNNSALYTTKYNNRTMLININSPLDFGISFGLTYKFQIKKYDFDLDGIPDFKDKCPKFPEDNDGFQDNDGCPDPDNDGDKIPDIKDRCPMLPEDFDNFQDNDGCPDIDNDNDGILDSLDKCPGTDQNNLRTKEDFDNDHDSDGCPDITKIIDSDNDEIPDSIDKCPQEPEDFDNFQDNDGCPDVDNDNDGILDKKDLCPNRAETFNSFEDNDGCPDINMSYNTKKSIQKKITKFPTKLNVYFKGSTIRIENKSIPKLNKLIRLLNKNNMYIIEVHTNTEANEQLNINLSTRRAKTIKRYLIRFGNFSPNRIFAKGWGTKRPIANVDNPQAKEINNRIEIRELED